MKRVAQILAAALLGAAFIVPAAAQDVAVTPGQDYVQTATGMVFPPHVGAFERGRVYRYAPDGSDESAGYNLIRPRGTIAATVYVYPSPGLEVGPGSSPETVLAAQTLLCSTQFDRVQQEIVMSYQDEVLLSEGAASHGDSLGFTAAYAFTAPNFLGRRNEPVKSEAYLFCFVGERWSVKYRFSYPADHDASADIAAFMRDFTWTIGQGTPL